VSAIAASSSSSYLHAHTAVVPGAALDHGIQTSLYALTALLVGGVLIAAFLVRPKPRPAPVETVLEHELAEAA
jgi:hypothetical protein